MKKLLVLALVMSVATVASATVVWNTSVVGNTISIALYANESISSFTLGTPVALTASKTGTWSAWNTNDSFAADALLTANGTINAGKVYSVKGGIGVGGTPVTGNLWVVTYTLSAPLVGEVVFTPAVNANYIPAVGQAGTIGSFSVVPEPVTVALLGLGGLFIRRRKVA